MKRPLISTDKYFLLVYETAADAAQGYAVGAHVAAATTDAAYWSKTLNCQVWYSEPGDIFKVLNRKNHLYKVLHGNRVGWIFNYNWIGLKEINND